MVRLKAKPGHKQLVTSIRLSEIERDEVQRAADVAGVPLRAFIREAALEKARRGRR